MPASWMAFQNGNGLPMGALRHTGRKLNTLEQMEQSMAAHRDLFFDILGDASEENRDKKIKRVASDRAVHEMERAPSIDSNRSSIGRSSSSNMRKSSSEPLPQQGAQHSEQQEPTCGSRLDRRSPEIQPAPPAAAQQEDHIVEELLHELDGAGASKLLRDLCGDMYIDPSQLEDVEPIGQGAFATVKKCRLWKPRTPAEFALRRPSPGSHNMPSQLVAVKQLKPAVLGDETELHGFIAETDMLRRLRHPSIVEFKGVGAMNCASASAMRRSMFLVQELMAGGTLKSLLVDAYYSSDATRLYSRQDAMRWALQIAEALAYLHHFSPLIVHRDVKPENVLLTSPVPSRANAKLADFGLHKCIKDVASGVPMAQSTAQLAEMLQEMGFDQPGHQRNASADDDASGSGQPDRQPDGLAAGAGARTCGAAAEAASASEPLLPVGSSSKMSTDVTGLDSVQEQAPQLPNSPFQPLQQQQQQQQRRHSPLLHMSASTPELSLLNSRAADNARCNTAQLLPHHQNASMLFQANADATVGQQPLLAGASTAAARLSQEDSAQLNVLPTDAAAVLHEPLRRRSNSGSLLPALLQNSPMQNAQPCLAVRSMGILGRDMEDGPAARLPPLPRGAGVAERLRGIRAVTRESDRGGEEGKEAAEKEAAALNATIAAKIRESREWDGEGLKEEPDTPVSRQKSFLAALLSRTRHPARHRWAAGGARPGSSGAQSTAGGDSSVSSGGGRRSHLMHQLKRVSLARASCGLASDSSDADASIHAANLAYQMTGQTGSLLYLAPEVLRGTFYNEKVDVFSLGAVMWEMFSYTPTIAVVPGGGVVDRALGYAERVADGFRQALPEEWPQEVRALIADCWSPNPIRRPSAARVAKRLRAMQEFNIPWRWDQADLKARALQHPHCCDCLRAPQVMA